MFKLVTLILVLLAAACVPRPEQITGCGTGLSFNAETLSCVNASPDFTWSSSFTALAVTEDVPQAFSLPTATATDAVGGIYYFITRAPDFGDITGCADRDGGGDATGTGTSSTSCTYTPVANYGGTDTFEYKACNSLRGDLRCTAAVSVAVTISSVDDAPTITLAPTLSVYEGSSINFDIKATARGPDESDNIYVCLAIDAGLASAVSSPAGFKVTSPTGSFAIGSCTFVATESGNLLNAISRFTGTANLLACPLDDCTASGVLTVTLCENAGCTGPTVSATSTITILAKNFAPTFAAANPYAFATHFNEGAAVLTIGTNVASDYDLPLATDADTDSFTYSYVAGSLTPTSAGTLSCTPGSDLACTFTPSADYSGAMTFSYRATDSKGAVSSTQRVSFTVDPVNDPPVFKTGEVSALTTIALSENTVYGPKTMPVSEGGGSDENTQTVGLSATSTDTSVVPLSALAVLRNGSVLGDLSSSRALDDGLTDADIFSYGLRITPPTDLVTDSPSTISLTLNDGAGGTASKSFTVSRIANLDDTPVFSADPPTSFGLQLGQSNDFTFRASPGLNDWRSVTGGSQDLVVTLTSTAGSVVDASAAALGISASVATATKRAGCTTTTCIWDVAYTRSNDPTDDDMTFTITPATRGVTTLSIAISDGTSIVTRNIATAVHQYVASFNGWSMVKALGPITYNGKQATRTTDPATVTVGWNALTVTDGGTPITNYRVRVYRKASSAASTLSGSALSDAGTASTTLQASFSNANAPFNDGSTFSSGERFYLALAVVPDDLGDPLTPAATTDQSIEIVIPPDNMGLVHRWMANREFCTATGQTSDRNNSYRCSNKALGAVTVAGTKYYDQLQHTFFDVFEAGCPYNFAEDTTPSYVASANTGKIHYNRATQRCTISDGTSWVSFTASAVAANDYLNEGQLPPLVNITRTAAENLCENQNIVCDSGVCPVDFSTLQRELPTRREVTAASVWPTTSPSASTISQLEDSGDATLFSCNTASGNGATFTTIGGLTSLVQDTFPTDGVSSKALMNSATSTKFCESRYGMKSIIGNVAEWLADTYSCTLMTAPNVSCTIATPLGSLAGTSRDDSLSANNSLALTYGFDATVGHAPLLQNATTLSAITSILTSNADRFHLAVGLPFLENSSLAHPQEGLPRYINTGSGANVINGTMLSNDGIGINYNSNGADYALVHGGDYSNGNKAGRWASKLRQDGQTESKTGFRCLVRITPQP